MLAYHRTRLDKYPTEGTYLKLLPLELLHMLSYYDVSCNYTIFDHEARKNPNEFRLHLLVDTETGAAELATINVVVDKVEYVSNNNKTYRGREAVYHFFDEGRGRLQLAGDTSLTFDNKRDELLIHKRLRGGYLISPITPCIELVETLYKVIPTHI